MKPNLKRLIAALAVAIVLAVAFFIQNGSVSNSGPGAAASVSVQDTSAAPSSVNAVSPEISAAPSESTDSNAAMKNPSSKPSDTLAPVTSAQPEETAPPETASSTCSLTISCKTILDNIDKLTKGKETLAPTDGWLLNLTDVKYTEGETVLDVLKRELKARDMHLEFSVSPLYNTVYIEGICNLYELDCGELSGWMFTVNGVFPNVGCGEYKLSDRDNIAFVYTCDLGRDVEEASA
ncbi:MAG: hypothetical protein CVU91_11855 [Firmicutes bacterium HGW-Firmicutes-16]|nr:MAG: hypothetical protein CVU91_11855 [Firmicutes bacterium HGW-Firmicutes-16]